MRDDRHRWPVASVPQAVDLGRAMLVPAPGLGQVLVSGPRVLSQVDLPLVHWPDVVRDACYALCLRRDRVLLVNATAREDGWDDALSQAVNDASDAWAVFDLEGPGAFELLRRGAELSLDEPSKSVMRRVFGLDVMLYRVGEDRFRAHVPVAWQDAWVAHLQSAWDGVKARL